MVHLLIILKENYPSRCSIASTEYAVVITPYLSNKLKVKDKFEYMLYVDVIFTLRYHSSVLSFNALRAIGGYFMAPISVEWH